MTIPVLVAALVAIFIFGCTIPELARSTRVAPAGEPISYYLTGPRHLYEVAGFCAMSLALLLLSTQLGPAGATLAAVIAAAVIMAAVSDTWRGLLGKHHRAIHLVAAGTAFLIAFVLELLVSIRTGSVLLSVVTAVYPAAVGFIYWEWPLATAWQEKAAASSICLWLVAWAVRAIVAALTGVSL